MTDQITEFKNRIDLYNKREEKTKIFYKINESLKEHTTFRIGGNASLFLSVKDAASMLTVLKLAAETGVRSFILGRGSNVLFSDAGFNGIIISTSELNHVSVEDCRVTASAGAAMSSAAREAMENSLEGMEFLYGIPGSCGGGVYMNAGAYTGEMAYIVESTTYIDREKLEICTINNAEHKFAYRESVFKHINAVIIESTFKLKNGSREEIEFKMNDFIKRRTQKQPLEYPSAGSVFKRYPGRYTAQMIDEAGLKGYSVGGAQVSEKHAGFIINRGNATCDDVLKLIDIVKNRILKLYGIEIECEIIHVS